MASVRIDIVVQRNILACVKTINHTLGNSEIIELNLEGKSM